MQRWRIVDVDGPVGSDPVTAGFADGSDERVLLVRDEDGRLHATATGCPHLGQPLSLGHVDGAVLECDHHAFRYRLSDGVCVGPDSLLAGRLLVHEVRERDGRIEVALAAEDA